MLRSSEGRVLVHGQRAFQSPSLQYLSRPLISSSPCSLQLPHTLPKPDHAPNCLPDRPPFRCRAARRRARPRRDAHLAGPAADPLLVHLGDRRCASLLSCSLPNSSGTLWELTLERLRALVDFSGPKPESFALGNLPSIIKCDLLLPSFPSESSADLNLLLFLSLLSLLRAQS